MDQNEQLKKILAELETASKQGKDLNALISEYKAKLQPQTTPQPIQPPVLQQPQPAAQAATDPTKFQHKKSFWENWYQENNILALLYLGTLLILLSAVTFVAFNWTEITGITKTLGLSFVTVGFLLSGLYMYHKTENLKIGGTTFATIGALLIPFSGIALYNFVLKSQEGAIWLTTSAISLAVFFYFTKIFDKPFFKYMAALTTLSFAESFIKVGNFETKYYILGAIISAFTLLLLSRQSQEKDLKSPFSYSANVILPLALLLGLFRALIDNEFFDPHVYLAILFAAVFYTTIFYLYKSYAVISIAVALYTLFIANYFYAVFENDLVAFYAAFLLLSCFAGAVTYVKKTGKDHLANALIESVVILSALLYLFSSVIRESYGSNLQITDSLWFSLIVIVLGVIVYKTNRSPVFLYVSQIFYLVAANLVSFEIIDSLTRNQERGLFVLLVMFLTIVNYLLSTSQKERAAKITFLQLTVLSSIIAMYASLQNEQQLILTSLALAILYMHMAVTEKKEYLAYVSGGLLYIALWCGFKELKVETRFIPIYFSIFTGCLFAIEWGTTSEMKVYLKSLVNAGLIITSLTLFGARQSGHYDTISRCGTNAARYGGVSSI